MSPPARWARAQKEESDYAYRLPSGAIAAVASACNRPLNLPLEALTRNLLIGMRKIDIDKQERVHGGLHSVLKATLEGVPFNLELFVLQRGDCVFDFSLISPKPIPAPESQEFLGLVKSFDYGKRS